MKKKVALNKIMGIAWVLFGAIAFALGWQNSVALVWLASVYANAKTDWGTAEAADDRAILERLDRIEALLIERNESNVDPTR